MTPTGELCTCLHDRKYHRKQIDNRKQISYPCVHAIGFQFCECKNYKPTSAIAQQGDEMTKEKKVRAPKAKVRTITHYEVSAKEVKLRETLASKESDSQLAIIYRAVAENGPCSFDGVWEKVYRNFQSSKAPLEKRKINVGTYLHRLVKAGLLKRSKVEEKASEAAA
jgi:hypothetical protein